MDRMLHKRSRSKLVEVCLVACRAITPHGSTEAPRKRQSGENDLIVEEAVPARRNTLAGRSYCSCKERFSRPCEGGGGGKARLTSTDSRLSRKTYWRPDRA